MALLTLICLLAALGLFTIQATKHKDKTAAGLAFIALSLIFASFATFEAAVKAAG